MLKFSGTTEISKTDRDEATQARRSVSAESGAHVEAKREVGGAGEIHQAERHPKKLWAFSSKLHGTVCRIKAMNHEHPIKAMCEVLAVSQSE